MLAGSSAFRGQEQPASSPRRGRLEWVKVDYRPGVWSPVKRVHAARVLRAGVRGAGKVTKCCSLG